MVSDKSPLWLSSETLVELQEFGRVQKLWLSSETSQMSVTLSHNHGFLIVTLIWQYQGFPKYPSLNFMIQAFPNVNHTFGNTRIFLSFITRSHYPGVSKCPSHIQHYQDYPKCASHTWQF